MRNRQIGVVQLIVFIIRGLERLLPVRALYWTLKPFVFAQRAERLAVPGYFEQTRPSGKTPRVKPRAALNYVIGYLEDRLTAGKWQRCCQMSGLEGLQKARDEGRPVVLAMVHFGPVFLLPCWLRSAGIRLITLRNGKAESRIRLKRMKDRLSPFPEIPTVLYLDQLRELVGVLSAGNALLIAIDQPNGKLVDVPLDNGWTFRMATGAIRLASRYGAELIPCSIIEEGNWRFRIEVGQPVPTEYLAGEPDMVRAGKHLLTQMFPQIQPHLAQCRPVFFQCFHHEGTLENSRRRGGDGSSPLVLPPFCGDKLSPPQVSGSSPNATKVSPERLHL